VRMARFSVEPTSAVNILLATPAKLPAGTRDELIRIVHEVRGGDPSVRVIALREVLEEVAPQP